MINQAIGIIGFGAQAKAWALNLRDSNSQVIIFLREGSSSFDLCRELGFQTRVLNSQNFSDLSYLCLLTPDHTHVDVLKNIQLKNKKIILAHGYSYAFEKLGTLFPELEFILLAPKAIASEIRLSYETKKKVAALVSFEGVENKNIKEVESAINSIAKAIGFTCGPFSTTFENETKADLFSEQAILCSMLPYLSLISYNKLRDLGIEKEAAYLECFHEMKLIINALSEFGPAKFFEIISPNALIGSQKGVEYLLDDHFKGKLNLLLEDINNLKIKEEFDKAEIETLQANVVDFWNKQEFSQTHNEIQALLKN